MLPGFDHAPRNLTPQDLSIAALGDFFDLPVTPHEITATHTGHAMRLGYRSRIQVWSVSVAFGIP